MTSPKSESGHQRKRTASFSQSSPSPVPLFTGRPPLVKEISQAGWTFRSIRSSISSASQIEEISHNVGFPLPTMFFGSNRVEIVGPNGFELHLDPIEVINSVSKSAESVSVTIAAARDEFWRRKSEEEQIFDYDWTYSPQAYYGSMKGHLSVGPSALSINYARLKHQDPILFFDENILYEDELGDNGISLVSAKIRVMEYGFLLLFNHFMRVDRVLFKVDSCRYYHEFGQPVILRELRHGEDSFEAVTSKLVLSGASFKDNDTVIQTLPIQTLTTEEIKLN